MKLLRAGWVPALFFAVAAVVLTWPLAWSPGASISVRGDYYLGLWNFWWVTEAVFELGTSPWWTEHVHFPAGVSLVRHVLSPANSLAGGLLARVVGGPTAFEWLLLLHFWLAGWFFFLFARELTGSAAGAALAGLAWAFGPFHFYYLPQMNVATTELLPLAAWFFVRAHRAPGWRPVLGAAVASGLLAATSSYYVVYAAMLGGLLLLGGRLWAPETPWREGATRLVAAGMLSALAVLGVTWRAFAAGFEHTAGDDLAHRIARSNDLLGFLWVGGPEMVIVSWPTMLGWVACGVALAGLRLDRRRAAWLGAALLFALLSLGPRLHVGGILRGVPLPDGWLAEAPLFWMLRKPDRMFVMVQLCLCVLLAYGWRELAGRRLRDGKGLLAWGACAAALCLETAAVPLRTFEDPVSPGMEKLAGMQDVRAVANLPAFGGSPQAARSSREQTIHGHKITDGYVVNLTLDDVHTAQPEPWRDAHKALRERADARPLRELARAQGVDVIVVHQDVLVEREPEAIDGPIWGPFVLHARQLVGIRQRGHLELRRRPGAVRLQEATGLGLALGPPIHSDESVTIFRVPPPPPARAAESGPTAAGGEPSG